MARIVIINAVPINGGDEALLRATLIGLKEFYNDPSVLVLCNNPGLYKKFFPDIELDWDWEYTFLKANYNETLLFKINRRIRHLLKRYFNISYYHKISRFFASCNERRIFNELSKSDMIIVSAGGYIHDFYGYNKRLDTLEFIHDHLKKPYYIFSQSVGPFWKNKNFPRLRKVFNNAHKVILREVYSMEHLKSIDYHCKNVVVTNDIAFLLNKYHNKKADSPRELKKIAINFREWKYEKESVGTLEKARTLCAKLINEGYLLTFISTCQGVENYTDDSLYAEKVVSQLTAEEQEQCVILKDKFSLDELLLKFTEQDVYIGMRLHGAILSLIAGIPALNIAYEDKTLGIFESLGLVDYCFSYKEEQECWNYKVDHFINNYHDYLKEINPITTTASEVVSKNFEWLK